MTGGGGRPGQASARDTSGGCEGGHETRLCDGEGAPRVDGRDEVILVHRSVGDVLPPEGCHQDQAQEHRHMVDWNVLWVAVLQITRTCLVGSNETCTGIVGHT